MLHLRSYTFAPALPTVAPTAVAPTAVAPTAVTPTAPTTCTPTKKKKFRPRLGSYPATQPPTPRQQHVNSTSTTSQQHVNTSSWFRTTKPTK